MSIALLDPEVAPQWCCGSSSAADPEIGVSAAAGGGSGSPAAAAAQGPKSARVKRMVRLAAELLLLLGLLLLTLHITVLRSSPLQHGNATVSSEQVAEVSFMKTRPHHFFFSKNQRSFIFASRKLIVRPFRFFNHNNYIFVCLLLSFFILFFPLP